MKNPIQPTKVDDHGVIRFKENKIVRKLLDEGPFDMNQIAMWDIDPDDRVQFAQLIGYSLSGFGSLSYVDDEVYAAANLMVEEGKNEKDARIEFLQERVSSVREKIRDGVAELFEMHPTDLGRD